MKKLLLLLVIAATISACGDGKKETNASLDGKKKELEKLKTEAGTLADKIKKLEKEISAQDTANGKVETARIVGTTVLATQNFTHYIDLQGRVDADNISYVSPRFGPGQVKAIYVKKGDIVKKGQLLLKLDDAIVKQSVFAAVKGLEALKTQLAFAKDIYNRQNNLWSQGIGTEVQLLSAKNNVETLEKQLEASKENIKVAEEQLKGTNIYADVNGIADEVNVRVGETFTGFMGQQPQIKLVNTASLKVVTDVPENYSSKVRIGSKTVIVLPDVNKTYNSSVYLAGKVINPNNRSFEINMHIPFDGLVRPNQIAQVKIQDYAASNAIAIPVNTVQTDEKGKYVYVAVKENNKVVARKKAIAVGELYGQLIEVRTGLVAGDVLVTEGYQTIYEGQELKTNIK